MEASQLLLEYLRENYTQARQHETRQTAATTFLTSAAAAIIALNFKDGQLVHDRWWIGLTVALIGLTNLLIVRAHYTGNRFHVAMAGEIREELEKRCSDWNNSPKTTEMRNKVLHEKGLIVDDPSGGVDEHGQPKRVPISIGSLTYERIRLVPIIVTGFGVLLACLALVQKT